MKVNEVFSQKVPLLLKKVASFRDKFLHSAQGQVPKAPPDIALAFFARCPPLDNSESVLPFEKLLQDKEPRIRAAVPAPMMLHCSSAELGSHVSKLLTVAMSDSDPNTRLNVIKSFSLRHVESFFMIPSHIVCFATLVNDESFDVQCAVVELLTHLSKLNPFECSRSSDG